MRTDLTGRRFDLLVVLARVGTRARKTTWLCRCDCGVAVVRTTSTLRSPERHSCGCLAVEVGRLSATKHGGFGTPEYRCWTGIIQRCTNPANPSWARYGGRGIVVCERWRDFQAFLADMGLRPTPRHSIDRINNDGNYEPENCRWATPTEQARNTRSTKFVNVDGRAVPLAEATELLGITYSTLRGRIRRGELATAREGKP